MGPQGSWALVHRTTCTTCMAATGPPFYFLNNSPKLTDYNNFGTLNHEKVWHEHRIDLPTSPVRCSHFTVGNRRKSHFFNIIHIGLLQIICVILEENKRQLLNCSFSCLLSLLLFNASYYLHSPSRPTASGARYNLQEQRVYWYGRVEAYGLLRHGLNFNTVWCTVRLISVEKDWKHVLTQEVVTLNTCRDIACLTFQLPHIITGTFQSHRRQTTTGSFRNCQRLKERSEPSVIWKSFLPCTSYSVVTFSGRVGKWIRLQFVLFWHNFNNQKYVWIILVKNDGFPKIK